MSEPEEIIAYIEKHFNKNSLPLNGKKALVTAGPTYEAIDPVRFIGNHSSGKMGFALDEEFDARGAEGHLVCGPTPLVVTHTAINRTDVVSAADLDRKRTSLNSSHSCGYSMHSYSCKRNR